MTSPRAAPTVLTPNAEKVAYALTQLELVVILREVEFDVAELAIATFLQAKAHGKPLVLLPVVVRGKFAHSTLSYNAERGPLAPSDLPGRRVGIRAYAQTTPLWVRGILQNEYGVDLDRVKWITFEDPHVAEYREPATA